MASLSFDFVKKISSNVFRPYRLKTRINTGFTAYLFREFWLADYKSAALPLSHTSLKSQLFKPLF